MTIAIKIELKEDWGMNMPCVTVMARALLPSRLGYPAKDGADYQVARLTPMSPVAEVTITKDRDLYFKVDPATDEKLELARGR